MRARAMRQTLQPLDDFLLSSTYYSLLLSTPLQHFSLLSRDRRRNRRDYLLLLLTTPYLYFLHLILCTTFYFLLLTTHFFFFSLLLYSSTPLQLFSLLSPNRSMKPSKLLTTTYYPISLYHYYLLPSYSIQIYYYSLLTIPKPSTHHTLFH